MPTQIIINNRRLIFGLSWMPAGKAHSKRDKNDFAKKRNANISSGLDIGDKVVFGATRFITTEKNGKKQPAYSGAALFLLWSGRHARDNASESTDSQAQYILVAELHDSKANIRDEVSLVAISGGSIYRDILIKASDISRTLQEISNEIGSKEVGGDIEIFSNIDTHETLLPGSKFFEIKELLEFDIKLAALKNITDKKAYAKTALVSITIFACAGYYFFDAYKTRKTEEENAVVTDPNIDYQKSLAQSLTKVGFSSSTASKEIWQKIGVIDLNRAGSFVRRIDCNKEQCKFKWVRSKFGLIKNFAEAKKPDEKLTIINQDTYETLKTFKTDVVSVDFSKLKTADDFTISTNNREQKLEALKNHASITFKIEKPVAFGLPNGIQASSLRANSIIRSGKISINFPLGLASEIINTIPNNIGITNISVILDDYKKPLVEVKGEYFVK
ncbi:hypothetical protein [Janthinobacterium sp. FW305-128]|uniref:hypothetical protein n=1 Tax=Janthinobacterium sp. FW305-128 TaxID=2775055 RepID=UPI001E5538CB|nr:hypothetical protein [Janthinobacterium sp. FW305-128]MCC7684714.1 hypothetical protein [Janthinobacterium sp. FW305-128]